MRPAPIRFRRASFAFAALSIVLGATPTLGFCPERPACHGCGCKGGPGWRGPNGRCVGFRRLNAVCGNPPGAPCIFENAPGTGANRECALAPRKKRYHAR